MTKQDALAELKDSFKILQHTIGRTEGVLDLSSVGLGGLSEELDDVMFDIETELDGDSNE